MYFCVRTTESHKGTCCGSNEFRVLCPSSNLPSIEAQELQRETGTPLGDPPPKPNSGTSLRFATQAYGRKPLLVGGLLSIATGG